MTPDETFAQLHKAADELCGAKLFTVTVLDRAAGLARRAYTSHPDDYPTTGTKPLGEDAWRRKVIDRGETFIANETEGFSPFFSDYPQINALGCESAINIPVKDHELVVATVNILDVENHFTPERADALEALVGRSTPALLRSFAQIKLA